MFFFSKKPNYFASAHVLAPFFMAKLMRTKQLFDCVAEQHLDEQHEVGFFEKTKLDFFKVGQTQSF